MIKATVKFDFKSYWHMGSGRGEGASLDAVVVRSPEGLPFIPGRTVKGLLREAVLLMEECDINLPKRTETLFGTDTQEKQVGSNKTRYETDAGLLRFTGAQLSDEFREWALTHREEVEFLYAALSSTKLDEDGLAKDKTLRRIEVCIPLELTANVEYMSDDKDESWFELLKQVTGFKEGGGFIRAAGSLRHRGLGRVKVTVEKVTKGVEG